MKECRRVVVTGDTSGLVVDDSVVEAAVLAPRGNALVTLWGETAPARLPGVSEPTGDPYLPAPGSWRVSLLTILPDSAPLLADGSGTVLPDLAARMARGPGRGMHLTATVDVVLVVEGAVVLELEDGREVALATGDSVVQRGVLHGWRNRTTEPAVLAVFMVGAHHDQG